MVAKKFRRVRAGELNGVIEVVVSGGLPVDADPEAPTRITKHRTTEGKRVRVTGGLPDVLQGELMTPEQRKLHDDQQYAAAHGQSGTLGTGFASKED